MVWFLVTGRSLYLYIENLVIDWYYIRLLIIKLLYKYQWRIIQVAKSKFLRVTRRNMCSYVKAYQVDQEIQCFRLPSFSKPFSWHYRFSLVHKMRLRRISFGVDWFFLTLVETTQWSVFIRALLLHLRCNIHVKYYLSYTTIFKSATCTDCYIRCLSCHQNHHNFTVSIEQRELVTCTHPIIIFKKDRLER